MDDPELDAIRQKRLAEMQGGQQFNPQEAQQREAMKKEQEERRQAILQAVLTADARERLSRVALVKAEKARGVEDLIIRAAQSGQLGGKVDEARLISLLGQLSEKEQKTKITFKRRGVDDDDD